MMSLKPPSILHCLDSMVVFAGRLFSDSALYITIVEAPTMPEVDLDDHWRFLSQLYKSCSMAKLFYCHYWLYISWHLSLYIDLHDFDESNYH